MLRVVSTTFTSSSSWIIDSCTVEVVIACVGSSGYTPSTHGCVCVVNGSFTQVAGEGSFMFLELPLSSALHVPCRGFLQTYIS